ncbi:MAG TPA: aminoacyl-tRNA hydrolase [Candidatus Aquicultor sp.]|jgi:PTH1 family peptidyl-tRNA hydrolase
MYIVVGLGNPGIEYETTRHNVGFMVIDRLADVANVKLNQKNRLARWGEGVVAGERVLLAQPLTFMNNSGVAVCQLLNDTQTTAEHLIVIYDDLDLEPGRIRVRTDGGSGGHKGIKSIIAQAGTDEFIRVRVGIGRPPGRMDAADYVLRPFSDRDWEEIEFAIIRATDAIEYIIENGVERAMNEFNRKEEVAE